MSTRVVIVDDIADVRWLLRAALHADGRFDVVGEAADGLEAVTVVNLTRPDVVVLDLRMPTMDGLEAALQIAETAPHTRILIYSGMDERALGRLHENGVAVSYLQKGARPRAIAEAVALTAAS